MASLLRKDPDVILWWGTPVESVSALARAVREARLESTAERSGRRVVEALRERAFEVQPSEEVRRRAIRLLGVHPLRAADALQLAAALVWCRERPSRAGLVCLDARLATAATREGFDVLP
jgi:predicted nucleic acid-binding protein